MVKSTIKQCGELKLIFLFGFLLVNALMFPSCDSWRGFCYSIPEEQQELKLGT